MNKTKLAFVLLASLLLGACGSDGDGDSNNGNGGNVAYTETAVSEAPVWGIDWQFNQERPAWTKPDGSSYGNWTIMMVQLEEALRPYASDEDMMAIFVNGEMRGLASPAEGTVKDGNATFLMKVYGNETGTETVNVSLQYYSKRLNQIFTLSDNINLNSDESTGIDEDYIPPFTLGSAKYPIVKTVGVESQLTKAGVPYSSAIFCSSRSLNIISLLFLQAIPPSSPRALRSILPFLVIGISASGNRVFGSMKGGRRLRSSFISAFFSRSPV